MENTFWDISGYGNFVESFKKSFTLYVESGMKKMVEIDIKTLGNVQGENFLNWDFMEKFQKFIVERYLRKFHCFYLHSTHLTTFFTQIQPTVGNTGQVGIKCLSWKEGMNKSLLGCKT